MPSHTQIETADPTSSSRAGAERSGTTPATALPIEPGRLTRAQKILLLATRSHTCEKSARKFLRGEMISGSAGERLALALRDLGFTRDT